jgi:hypothetical protein
MTIMNVELRLRKLEEKIEIQGALVALASITNIINTIAHMCEPRR